MINGGERVSQETLARVQAVIEKLGYQPNQAARILKGERTKTIGLIVPSIADSFFSVSLKWRKRSHALMIRFLSSLSPVTNRRSSWKSQRPHSPPYGRSSFAPAHSENRSLANMLDTLSTPERHLRPALVHSTVPSVVSNNYKGAKDATQHLIMHGRKRILCLGGEIDLYTIKERIRGYKDAVRQARLDAIVDTSVKDYESAKSAIESHFYSSNPPDAVFALKNFVTIYAYEVFQKLNINIPRKVALLGLMISNLLRRFAHRSASYASPAEDVGRIAAELLFDQLVNATEACHCMAIRPSRNISSWKISWC